MFTKNLLSAALLSAALLSVAPAAHATAYNYRQLISGLQGSATSASNGNTGFWLVTLDPSLTDPTYGVPYLVASKTLSATCPAGDIDLSQGAYFGKPLSSPSLAHIDSTDWQIPNSDASLQGMGYKAMTVCIPAKNSQIGYLGSCTIPAGVTSGGETALSGTGDPNPVGFLKSVTQYTINESLSWTDACNNTSGTGSLAGFCHLSDTFYWPDGTQAGIFPQYNGLSTTNGGQTIGQASALLNVGGTIYYLATGRIDVQAYDNNTGVTEDTLFDYRYAGPLTSAAAANYDVNLAMYDDVNGYELFPLAISIPYGLDTSSSGNVTQPSSTACP